jgi:phage shock protein PspC (stress-responsive transcriptional regulator)
LAESHLQRRIINLLSILDILCERFCLGAAAPKASIAENFYVIVTLVILFFAISLLFYGISIGLAIAYLLIVQIIDSRGEMLPAPIVEILFPGLG